MRDAVNRTLWLEEKAGQGSNHGVTNSASQRDVSLSSVSTATRAAPHR